MRSRPIPSPRRREAGSVMILVLFALVALLAFASLAIDGGYALHTRAELQHAADASALAAMGNLRSGNTTGTSRAAGQQLALQHVGGGRTVELGDGDLERGTFDFRTQRFHPGAGPGVAAFRAHARRDQGSRAGRLPLFLGSVLGLSELDVSASAVAAMRRRDIVIVQDVTYSFLNEFPDAIVADLALVDQLHGPRALAGDRVGLVAFARRVRQQHDLVDLATNYARVTGDIRALQVCTSGSAATGCDGTGIADGINAAREVFRRGSSGEDAEKVLVLLSDGVPCYQVGGSYVTAPGKRDAVEAADAALAEGISIFPITLAVYDGSTSICWIPDPAFNESLVRGIGIALTTPDSKQLDDLLISILQRMPVRLVQ